MKKQRKIYDFDCASPFEMSKRIELIDNSYFIQITVENRMHYPVYVEEVSFQLQKMNGLAVTDHNFVDKESIFDKSAAFAPLATRDYLF